MCGVHSGPDHDDPTASALCDAYHGFDRGDLPLLERELSGRDKEIAWQVAIGIGPDALAGRLRVTGDSVRAEMRAVTARLLELHSNRESQP